MSGDDRPLDAARGGAAAEEQFEGIYVVSEGLVGWFSRVDEFVVPEEGLAEGSEAAVSKVVAVHQREGHQPVDEFLLDEVLGEDSEGVAELCDGPCEVVVVRDTLVVGVACRRLLEQEVDF